MSKLVDALTLAKLPAGGIPHDGEQNSLTFEGLDLASRPERVEQTVHAILHGSLDDILASRAPGDSLSPSNASGENVDTPSSTQPGAPTPLILSGSSRPSSRVRDPNLAAITAPSVQATAPVSATAAAPAATASAAASAANNANNIRHQDVPGIISRLSTFLDQIRKNEFDSNAAGWGANVVNATLRDGVTVFGVDVIRELTGAIVEHGMDGLSPTAKAAISGSLLGGAIMLNVYAMARERNDKTLTATSATGRAINIAALATTLGVAWGTGHTDGLAAVAPGLVKGNIGAMLRDIANLFHHLDDNHSTNPARTKEPSIKAGVAASTMNGAIYGTQQTILGATAMQPIGSGTSGIVQGLPLKDGMKHIAGFSAVAGASEAIDALTLASTQAFFNNADASVDGIRNGIRAVVNTRLSSKKNFKIPTLEEVHNKMTGTFTSRVSMVNTVYGLSGVSGNYTPEHMSDSDVEWMQNALESLPEFLLYPAFMAGLEKKKPPPPAG